MRMKARMLAAVLVVGGAGEALAVARGGTLYVKAKNTRLMASSDPKARALAVLQPGQQVKWLGADAKNKRWHQVEVDGKRGVVFQTTLATRPPSMELVASQDGVARKNASEFANSAAAVKLLSDGAIEYGNAKGGAVKNAVGQLQSLEKLAQAVTEADCAEHARQAGLFPVVGPSARVAQANAWAKENP